MESVGPGHVRSYPDLPHSFRENRVASSINPRRPERRFCLPTNRGPPKNLPFPIFVVLDFYLIVLLMVDAPVSLPDINM